MLAIGVLAAIAATAYAGQKPATGINGSFHDITFLGATRGDYNQDDFQRVCIFCHTPHNAQTSGAVPTPLWNHEPSPVDLAPYTWAAPANLPITFNVDPLVGPSRLCMGCHDGVTAVDKHGPTTMGQTTAGNNNGNTPLMNPSRRITDLTVTHPIGFLYHEAMNVRNTDPNKPELLDPATNYFIDRLPQGAAAADWDTNINMRTLATFTTKKISDVLYSDYVTCASCHEVHNYRNSTNDPSVSNPSYTPNYFVWAREQGSALCVSCHYK